MQLTRDGINLPPVTVGSIMDKDNNPYGDVINVKQEIDSPKSNLRDGKRYIMRFQLTRLADVPLGQCPQ